MESELEPSTREQIEESVYNHTRTGIHNTVQHAHTNGIPLGPLREHVISAFDEAAKELIGETLAERLEKLAASIPDRDVLTMPVSTRDYLREHVIAIFDEAANIPDRDVLTRLVSTRDYLRDGMAE